MSRQPSKISVRYPSCDEEGQLETLLAKLCPDGLKGAAFPVVSWDECSGKGCFSAQLVCRTRDPVEIHDFFCEMVRRWLVPGRFLPLTEVRQWAFGHGEDEFYCGKVVVQVLRPKDAASARENFDLLIPEIRLGVGSPSEAWRVLQVKGMTPQRKVDLMHQAMLSLHRRRPEAFDGKMLEDVQHFMLECREDYREIRSVRHLCRIIYSLYFLRSELRKAFQLQPGRRHLDLRIMRATLSYPFGEKRVLGVALALTAMLPYELLDEEHVAKGVKHLVPRLRVVEDSYFSYQHRDDPVRAIYFEIETVDGGSPSGEELTQLRRELAGELRGRVERLSHPVFSPRNEEEIFRTVMALAQELRYVRDVPQVSLHFVQQDRRTVTWNVIVVRLWGEEQPTLEELAERLPAGVQFHLDEELVAGYLRKKHQKKASIFRLTFDREPFLRRDSSVDLPRARQFVVRLLTGMLGEVRDFTGGLMIKQREVLSATRTLLSSHEQRQDFLLENLFYSISPAVMQSYVDPQLVKALFRLLLDMREISIPRRDGFLLRTDTIDEARLVMVRSEDKSFRAELEGAVGALGFEALEIATARVQMQGSYYIGYICPSGEGASGKLAGAAERAMRGWSQRLQSEQSIRINLPRPSRSYDPRICVDRQSGMLMKMLYSGLMRLDQEGKPEPDVAERVEVSPDGTTYTFYLRQCSWTNGEPVTARDFEYTWKSVLEPEFESRYVYFLFSIKGAREANEGEIPVDEVGIRVEGDHKLVVELCHPLPYFLELLCHWMMLPIYRAVDEAHPGSTHVAGADLICNGPFRILSAPAKGELTLAKNDLYWEAERVSLDRISVLSIEDPHTAMAMFETGSLDWVGEPFCALPSSMLSRLKEDPRVITVDGAVLYRIDLNVDVFPFNNRKVRQAFAMAVNRQQVIDKVTRCGELPALSLIPPLLAGGGRSLIRNGAVKEARKLLAEGIKELGVQDIGKIVLNHAIFEDQRAVLQEVASQWEEAFGIEVEVEGVPYKSFLKYILTQDIQATSILWFTWVGDQYYNFEPWRYGLSYLNPSRWESDECVALQVRAEEERDPKKRQELFEKVEDLVVEEMPVIPVYFYRYRYLCNSRIQGAKLLPVGQVDFSRVHVDRREE